MEESKGIWIKFEVPNADPISRYMEGVTRIPDDFTPAWEGFKTSDGSPQKGIIEEFELYEEATFNNSGAYDSKKKWAELTQKYREYKYLQVGNEPILVFRGNLRDSLTDSKDSNAIRLPEKRQLTLGTSLEVGKKKKWNLGMLHQMGTNKMPARKPIDVGNKQRAKWAGIIKNFLESRIENLGTKVKTSKWKK